MGIALVEEVDVLRELGEVCCKGVEKNRLSLRRGGHCEWTSPIYNVGRTRRVAQRTATEKRRMCLVPGALPKTNGRRAKGELEQMWKTDARGRASKSLGVGNHGG